MNEWEQLISDAAEAVERFGDDELEKYAMQLRLDEYHEALLETISYGFDRPGSV